MLWSAFILLLILWFTGVVATYPLGGFIHVLLALAVIVLLAQVITRDGRRGRDREAAQKANFRDHEPEEEQRRDGAA